MLANRRALRPDRDGAMLGSTYSINRTRSWSYVVKYRTVAGTDITLHVGRRTDLMLCELDVTDASILAIFYPFSTTSRPANEHLHRRSIYSEHNHNQDHIRYMECLDRPYMVGAKPRHMAVMPSLRGILIKASFETDMLLVTNVRSCAIALLSNGLPYKYVSLRFFIRETQSKRKETIWDAGAPHDVASAKTP